MRNLLLIFTLCFISQTTFAAGPSYNLTKFEINAESRILPQNEEGLYGNVEVDVRKKTLTMTIIKPFHCPAGRICAQVMAVPTIIKLPVMHMGVGFCGGNIIVAQRDLRRADGGLERIEITDNMGNRCADSQSATQAEIIVTEQGARDSHEIVSTISAVVAR